MATLFLSALLILSPLSKKKFIHKILGTYLFSHNHQSFVVTNTFPFHIILNPASIYLWRQLILFNNEAVWICHRL
jgi:hypothetical protein